MPMSPGPSTSNNWGWADILKRVFSLVELGPLYKNGLPSLSVTRVTTHSKTWVTTRSKQELSTTGQNRVEHNNSRICFQEDHEGSNWENREKLDWVWTKIWLIECINILSSLSLLNMTSKLSGVVILLDGSDIFLERDNPLKIDLLKQLKKLFSAWTVITVYESL
jgi:hypothetical protein